MGKHGRRSKDGLRHVSYQSQSQPAQNFEHGPYYSGRGGYSVISEELSRREYTPGLCFGELLTLKLMNEIAWDRRNLVIEKIAAPFLALKLYPVVDPTKLPRDKRGKRIVPGERSIKRWLASLRAQEYLRLHREDREHGNSYFVEPVFIWDSRWHLLAGIETAACIRTSGDYPNIWFERWAKSQSGHCGTTMPGSATVARQSGRGGTTECDASSLRSCHSGPDPRSRSSDQTAQRVIAPNGTRGGVESPSSEAERRSPNGHDPKPRKKGDGLAAVSIRGYESQVHELRRALKRKAITAETFAREIERLCEERAADQSTAELIDNELPVGKGAKSNLRADA